MSELLLELYSEEIPSWMQKSAEERFAAQFTTAFHKAGIKFENLKIYVGPCRVTLHVSDMEGSIAAKEVERKGPKVGAPEIAMQGFMKSCNVANIDEFEIRNIKGSDFYFYIDIQPSISVTEILPKIITDVIASYVWPKSMHWGNYDISWVRPLRNILCIFDGEVLEFNYAHLVSNNISYGHKFMYHEEFIVKSFTDYKKSLADRYVILDRLDREALIAEQLGIICAKEELIASKSPALLEEVAGLVEYPNVQLGKISNEFMNIPQEILITAMQVHQKYFHTTDKNGKLAPYFIFASNIISKDIKVVISGNEKVLAARLADAAFFYHQDCKSSLEEFTQKLSRVVFHANIGTMLEKVGRLQEMCKVLSKNPSAELLLAAKLCKADLETGVVDEFPELQGLMGKYYALNDGLGEKVANIIETHYSPAGTDDEIPKGEAAILALADKLDSLVSLYIAGERATSSKDPYALRRSALGIIRIIIAAELPLDIEQIVQQAVALHNKEIDSKYTKEITSFILERAKYFLKNEFATEVVNAALGNDLSDAKCKMGAMKEFLSAPAGENLLQLYKRAYNILASSTPASKVQEELLLDASEKDLVLRLSEAEKKIDELVTRHNYVDSLKELLSLEPHV